MGDLEAGEIVRVLMRIADGGRSQYELRIRAVERRDPAEPAQDVGDVAAEDTAVGVGLVDDHVFEVEQEIVPSLVAGQHGQMDHVWVGEQQARFLPGGVSGGCRSVPVVGGDLDLPSSQRAKAPELVLGESLGGIQVDSPRPGISQEAVDDRKIEAQALAGGSAGGDHEMLTALGRVPALCLMGPQLSDALGCQRVGELKVHLLGEGSSLSRPAGQHGLRRQLGVALRGEHIEEFGSHASVPK